MRVLVCGSRDWTDEDMVATVLDGVYAHRTSDDPFYGGFVLIEGGARGADRIAGRWADYQGPSVVTHLRYPADWTAHGKSAGPLRNRTMLEHGQPELVIAFKDAMWESHGGTEDMVEIAREAGVRTWVMSHA